MSVVRLTELLAWLAGAALLGWIVLDAWRTGRAFDESLLLSSREGEIEENLKEVAAGLESVEDRLDAGRAAERR